MRAKRVDQNQKDVVKALRDSGAYVFHLHEVGQGCPDLLVGINNQTYLVEVKMPKGKFTDAQIKSLLRSDLLSAKKSAESLVSADGRTNLSAVWSRLPIDVQGVLTEMTFNLGKKGLSEFNNFLAHLAKNQYAKAATEMLNSSWSKQVGDRAKTLANIIKSAV